MYGLFPALGRGGCGRGAARGCAGAQYVATLGRSVGLRRGAVRGRGGAQHAAASGRGVCLRCRAACGCAGGTAWGRAGAQPAGVLDSPEGWGRRVAHWLTAAVAAAGTALGAVAAHCPERLGAICLRAPEPYESGRGGALPDSRGACTAQLVRPWRAGPGRERHGAPRSTVPCAQVLLTHGRAPAGSGARGGGGGEGTTSHRGGSAPQSPMFSAPEPAPAGGAGVKTWNPRRGWGVLTPHGWQPACDRQGAPRRCGSPERGAGCGREGAVWA